MGEVRENHSEAPAYERQLLDVLGPVSGETRQQFEDLSAAEAEATALCAAYDAAAGTHSKFKENAELLVEKEAAKKLWLSSVSKVLDAKVQCKEVLSRESQVSDFARVAAVQSIFHVEPRERAEYAERFERALGRLDGLFQTGQVVFIRLGGSRQGYYRVIESGITAEIETARGTGQEDAPIFSVVVRTRALAGSEVSPQGASGYHRLTDVKYPNGLKLYGIKPTVSIEPEPIEILEGTDGKYDPRGPRYIIGDALSHPVAQEKNLARATALALAAQRQDIAIDLLVLQNERVKIELTRQIIETMGKLVTSRVVVEPDRYSHFKDIWLDDEAGSQAVAGVEVDLIHENRRRIGDCIRWLDLDRTRIEAGVTTAIDGLEEAVYSNKETAQRMIEVDTGRRNKLRFFKDVFGG